MNTRSVLFVYSLVALPFLAACNATKVQNERAGLQVQYLEIVTPEVEATCAALEKLHGIRFSEPVPGFGNARTASLSSGGLVGVRAPMAAHEQPVVRPYILVDDIDAAVKKAAQAGGKIAMASTEIPGDGGKFAIYMMGGIQHGFWKLPDPARDE